MTDKKKLLAARLPLGVGAGLAIGVGLGAALDNMALGIAIGFALVAGSGVATGSAGARRIEDKDNNS